MHRILEVKDQTLENVRHLERNLTQVNWEKEEMEHYYTRSLKRCLLEQRISESKKNEDLRKIQEQEYKISEELQRTSYNNTLMLWEKEQSEAYY